MLGDVLPDLMLLAIFFAFLLRREAKLIAAKRARVVSGTWQRSRRLAASTGARRPLSRVAAIAARAERTTQAASVSRTKRVARGAQSSLHTSIARASWFKRLYRRRLAMAGRRLAGILFEKATDVLGERNAPTVPDETTVPTLARTTLPDIQAPRRLLRRRLRRRRRAARRRRRGGRLACASWAPRAGAARVLRPTGLRAPRDDAHRLRGDACVTDTARPRWLLVLLAAQQPHEIQLWPSLAKLEGTTQLPRRSVIGIIRELEKRGLLEACPRDFAANQAGAT